MPRVTRETPGGNSKGRTRAGGVLDRIQPASFSPDQDIQVLLYGRSGSGKTTLWGTFPKPILAVVCSGGKKPGELRSVMTPENKGKIFQVVLERSQELHDLAEHAAETGKFRTVVLDHAGGLESLVLKEILGLDEMPQQRSWGLASREQYGQCTFQCKEAIVKLLNLDTNLVVVAHERTFKGEDDSDVIQPHVSTALTPSLTGWLVGAFDYVGQTFLRQKVEMRVRKIAGQEVERPVRTGGVEYCLRTGPDATYATKFRVPGKPPPDVIVSPTYEKIVSVINGEE
jgi:hypothetical protein